MEQETTINLHMEKEDIQIAVTAILEQLSLTPPEKSEHTQAEIIAYNMGLHLLFDCLRSTFE